MAISLSTFPRYKDGEDGLDVLAEHQIIQVVFGGFIHATSLPAPETGTATGGDAFTLTDTGADFVTAGIVAGQAIFNVTDGSTGIITAVTATSITIAQLVGGTSNLFAVGDSYSVGYGPRQLVLLTVEDAGNLPGFYRRNDANSGWLSLSTPTADNLNATTDPTVNDDTTQGYSKSSRWINTTSNEVFFCVDSTAGAAVWEKTTLTIEELGTMALEDSADYMDKLTFDPTGVDGDAFDALNHSGLNHGIVAPGTAILSQGTPGGTFTAVPLDFFINGVKYSYPGQTNVDPGFSAGQEFAYLGLDQNSDVGGTGQLVIKKQDSFTASELDSGIIEVGIVRSIAGGPGGNLDVINDSPYILNDHQKRSYVRSKFEGTSYDKEAVKVTNSSTALQFDAAAGSFIDGNNEIKLFSAVSNLTASKIVFNGTDYDIEAPAVLVADNAQYNPGAGLSAIPTGKFVAATILHSTRTNGLFYVHGRVAYDTFAEALSAEEDLGPVAGQQLSDVNAVAVVVIKEGEATVREVKDIRHKIGADNLPSLTQGTQNISTTFDGSVREKLSITYRQAASVIYADIEKEGGGDLTVQIDGSSHTLNCTTGGGAGGKATVALTPGTATVIQENFLYVELSGGTATFSASTTQPSGDVAIVGKANLLDLARFTANGDEPITTQNYNNAASIEGQGLFARTAERIRVDGPSYRSGVDPTVSITTNGGVIDTVQLALTTGRVYQYNRNTFDDLPSPNTFVIVNHPTTPFLEVASLDAIDVDANGVTLRGNNDRYGLNILGVQNSGGAGDRIYVLLPNGKYSSDQNALDDVSNFAITSVSPNLGDTAFRVCRLVFRYNTTNGGTITNLVSGGGFQDERGFPLGQGGGGGAGASQTSFTDGNFEVVNSGDPTKIAKFSASRITPGQTRTLSHPDADGIIVALDPSPGADLTGSGSRFDATVDVNATGFAAALHLDSDGNYIEADANESTAARCDALALAAGTGTVEVLIRGIIRNDAWNLTPGNPVYLSETAGALTQTAPTTSGSIVQQVGIALTADVLQFEPNSTVIELA